MKTRIFIISLLSCSLMSSFTLAGALPTKSINSGTIWFDQNNREVNAHGACIVKEGSLYYLFGEYKSDTSNLFVGFGCYSSADLLNWKFEKVVLPMQKEGLLGPNRVGERVKVMKCPDTDEFVMYMHCDDMKYNDPHVGYATSNSINGDYKFKGDLLYKGEYLRKWDLGTFKNSDGKGYLLTHEGFIYELSSDYKTVERLVVSHIAKGGESPAMFKSDGSYFLLFSNKTSWERNDNYYLTSTSLDGPWIQKGLFAPQGSLTWNSQCSFILPIINGTDTLNMYMGDRWSFPKQGSAATQVWQPITVKRGEMSISVFYDSWNFNQWNQYFPVNYNLKSIKSDIVKKGKWDTANDTFKSNEEGASILFSFEGKQMSIKGITNNMSGYAKIVLKNSKNEVIMNTIVDFYCKNEVPTRVFLSPELIFDRYTILIEVMGEHPSWSDKRFSNYGSTDNYVIVEDVMYQ